LLGDLYIAIGDQNELNENSWTTRIWFNPFTSWIWIGVFFLVFSGLISVIRTLKKES
jgi:cytochrome c biogenesis factor